MSDYDDEKKKREAEAAAAMAAAEKRRQQGPARTGDTQQLGSQGSAIVAGEQVTTPIDAPTLTDLKVVLSPEAQAAQGAQAGEQIAERVLWGNGKCHPPVSERRVAVPFNDGFDGHSQSFFDAGDQGVADAADTDASDLVDIRPSPPISPPDAEDKRLAADLHRGSWRRYATVAFLPIAFAALVAVVLWQSMSNQPMNLVELVRQGRLDEAQAAVDKVMVESEAVAPQTPQVPEAPVSDVMMIVSVSMPDAESFPDAQGVVTTVAQPEESAPVTHLWREAEPEEWVWLENMSMEPTPPAPIMPVVASTPLQVESAQAGVLPSATSAPVQVASAKVGVVPTAVTPRVVSPSPPPSPTRGEGVQKAKRDVTSDTPVVKSSPPTPSPPAPAPAAVAPAPPPKPAGLEVGAIYEVFEQSDGSLVFKKVK